MKTKTQIRSAASKKGWRSRKRMEKIHQSDLEAMAFCLRVVTPHILEAMADADPGATQDGKT